MAILKICEVEGCGKRVSAKGLCHMHYYRVKRGIPADQPARKTSRFLADLPALCSVDGCCAPRRSKGFCDAHYWRHRNGHDVGPPIEARSQGEKWVDHNGYVVFTDWSHSECDKNGRVFEHRAVMAETLGRKLLSGENVHHKNGWRADNCPENLELWVTFHPSGQRPADLVIWAREILARYEASPAILAGN